MNDTGLPIDERIMPRNSKYIQDYERSIQDLESFWSEKSRIIDWFENYNLILDDSNPPFFRWFTGGRTNACYNGIDRHARSEKRNKAALIWVGENGEEKIITYHGMLKRVVAFASILRRFGVMKGDRVAIYLPMIPEVVVAMYACARIGAPFTVIFSGFGASSLAERINDCGAKLVITSDGARRGGKIIDLKKIVDEALENTTTVEGVIVIRNTRNYVDMKEERDFWYHEMTPDEDTIECEEMDSNDPLFILYTSGTTGKPKGVVHSTGPYSVWVANTLKWAFDPNERDRWWCAADVGWITGHSYIVFAPFFLGLTSIMYEGAINYPTPDRMWSIIEYYGVNILYTSPTAIRMLMRYGDTYPLKHDLTSLRVLGTVGEPINPAAWKWYFEKIGGERCPIIDTYWQTETGGFIISPQNYYGTWYLKPGSATFPLPGIVPEILDENGKPLKDGEKGYICIKRPWPGMMIGLNGDEKRFRDVYFSKFKGYYYNGDYAVRDEDGYYWILGRADEVIKVSGHRLGTIEIEDTMVSLNEISEAAVIGKPDPVKGESIVVFVVPKLGVKTDHNTVEKLKKEIREKMGPIYVPDEIHFVDSVPKTRSGKIMRRVIKAVYLGNVPGDISTLENEASVDEIKRAIETIGKIK
ncbi:acetate--CoA ligase [Caldiplasma sukawensis]